MSMIPSVEKLLYAQWDHIYQSMLSEVNFGGSPAVPGGGSNANGRLQTLASIGKTTWPDFLALPFCGVQLDDYEETEYAAKRRHNFKTRFTIVAMVQVQATADNVFRVDDAMTQLRTLLYDDSNIDGIIRGLMPVLRDNANYTLGGNADMSNVTGTKIRWDTMPSGKGTTAVAYAEVGYEAHKIFTVGF